MKARKLVKLLTHENKELKKENLCEESVKSSQIVQNIQLKENYLPVSTRTYRMKSEFVEQDTTGLLKTGDAELCTNPDEAVEIVSQKEEKFKFKFKMKVDAEHNFSQLESWNCLKLTLLNVKEHFQMR